ncbi:MAG: 3-isopropylmalate dehydratase [Pyrinomonadaceae bacterium]
MSEYLTDCRIRIVRGVISTDDIIPGRYKHMYTNPADLAAHVFENLLPGFAATLTKDDVLYCPNIFGVGSSREQAVSALQAAGVTAVFAPRFGRIFFRNAWNLGLLALEIDELRAEEGERVRINLVEGSISTRSGLQHFQPPMREMLLMRKAGGLLASVKLREAQFRSQPPPHPR